MDELRTCIGRVVAETRVNGLPNCLRYRPYDPTVSRDLVLVSSRLPYVADTDCCLHRLIQKLGAYCDTTSVSGFGGEPTTVDHEINAKAHLSDVVSRVAAPGPACAAGTSGAIGYCPPRPVTTSRKRMPCSGPPPLGALVPGAHPSGPLAEGEAPLDSFMTNFKIVTKDQASTAHRKPMLPVELSGVLALRAATRYRLQ